MIFSAVFLTVPILLQIAESRLSDARIVFQKQLNTHVTNGHKSEILRAHSMLLPFEEGVVRRFVLTNGNHSIRQVFNCPEIFCI